MNARWLFLCGVVAALAGCPKPGGSDSSSSSGSEGASSSSSSGGCPQGTRGCGCNEGNTCTGALVCTAGTCADATTPGTLNGSCDTATPCSMADGVQLACSGGTCQFPGCPSGTTTCPCTAAGTCAESGTQCNADNNCTVSACTPGTLACACATGSTCDPGLGCVHSVCVSGTSVSISISNAAVRACDVLVRDGVRKVSSVSFSSSVAGEFVRRAPETAVSFTRKTDDNPGGSAVQLQLSGQGTAAATDVTVVQTRCFDRTGQPVATPGLLVR